MYCYTVKCTFDTTAPDVSQRWMKWLRDQHLADVLDSGASSAEIVHMDGDNECFEIRYRFPSRQAFERYQKEHAPRLRQEGLGLFPLELGLKYERTSGQVLLSRPGEDS